MVPQQGATACDALAAFNSWNDLAQRIGLPVARSLTPERRKKLIARLRDNGGLHAWEQALSNIARSSFLRGKNDRGWTCNFDFLLQPASFTKVHDGAYGNGAHAEDAALPREESKIERTMRIVAEESARMEARRAAPVQHLKLLPKEVLS